MWRMLADMTEQADFTVRNASRDDAPAMHALHTASVTGLCSTHYPLDVIRRWIARRTPEGYYPAIDRGEMVVCEAGQTLVGWAHAVPGEVVGLFVHPGWAGRGVGVRLLARCLEDARRGHTGPIRLVATLNAQAFYEKHGFRAIRRHAVRRNDVDVAVVHMELDR